MDLFAYAEGIKFRYVEHDFHGTNKGHGCIELRRCWTITEPNPLAQTASRTSVMARVANVHFLWDQS